MTKSSKRPRMKMDPNKYTVEPGRKKKEEDIKESDLFTEMLRSKSRGVRR